MAERGLFLFSFFMFPGLGDIYLASIHLRTGISLFLFFLLFCLAEDNLFSRSKDKYFSHLRYFFFLGGYKAFLFSWWTDEV